MLKIALSTLSAVLIACNALPADELPELLNPCGMTAEELAEGLHSPLDELTQDFLDAEEETGVNAVFLASVAALESGWGKSYAAEFRNNLFGLTCSDGTLRYFDSKRDCILHVATLLKEKYLDEDGAHYRGGTVEDIADVYADADDWAATVRDIMCQIGGDRYAAA